MDTTTVAIFKDPSTSFWLRRALTEALIRDPVDAANDADFLARFLDKRAKAILAHAQRGL